MSHKVQELKVGILVVSGFILLIFFLVIVSDIEFGSEKVTYNTSLAYVGGFEVGTPVRLGGMLIGRISAIDPPLPDSDEIRIEVEVEENSPIKEDSRAYLTSIGLLGEYYLEIMPGSPGSPLLKPGSTIESINATTFSQMAMPIGELAETLMVAISNINEMLGEDSQKQIFDLLSNTNEILSVNAVRISQLMANLNTTTMEFGKIAGRLDTLIGQNDAVIGQMMNNLDSTLAETHKLVQKLGNTFGTLDGMMAENAQSYQAIINNLERSSRNLEDFSRIIREKPWSLVRKSEPEPRRLPEN